MSQLELFPVPRDWWARPQPFYSARGGFAPIDVGNPPEPHPYLWNEPGAPPRKQAEVLGVVTLEEVETLRRAHE